jgi:hypothetical protein
MRSNSCLSCGASGSGTYCANCGAVLPHAEGAGFLPLIGWLLIPFSIPVYPLMGGLSTVAMIAAHRAALLFGTGDGVRLLAIAVTGCVAVLVTLGAERAVSRFKLYRGLRWTLRVVTAVVLALAALQDEADISPANAFAIAAIGAPLFLFIASRLDRVLGLGPERSTGARRPSLLDGINVRGAIAAGFVPGFLGLLLGREAGLLLGAALWAATTGIIIGFHLLRVLLRTTARGVAAGGRKVGWSTGWFGVIVRAAFWGALFGIGLGLLLSWMASEPPEVRHFIVPTTASLIVSLIVQTIRSRRRAVFARPRQ